MNNQFQEQEFSGNAKSFKKIVTLTLRHKKLLVGLVLSLVISVSLDCIIPLLNAYAIDTYFDSSKTNRFDNVVIFGSIYVFCGFLYFVGSFLFLNMAGLIEARVSYDLRKEAYEKLQQLSFSYFDVTAQGWIMARMTSDARTLSDIISWGLVDILWAIFLMIAILTILIFTNPILAIIIIVLTPIMLGFAIFIRKKVLHLYRVAKKINSQTTASFNESFQGSKTSKSLVIEDRNKNEFKDLVYSYKKATLRASKINATFGPVIFVVGYIGITAVLYTGGNFILNDVKIFDKVLTISTLYLFIDYTVKYFDPIMQISRVIGDFQQAQASAERITALIDEAVEIKDSEEVILKYGDTFNKKIENYEELLGDIEFRNVSFKYNTGEEVLKNFNLTIKRGETVAFVGHTGSGKSTIVNLICRFYEPTTGSVLIDGVDYKKRSIGWLHHNLGYVLQSPQLFSTTVKENIKYGRQDASLDEIIQAASLANADDFISQLEQGYDSLVGEGGNRLSLGQKQLISFARAIVANPKILVLDEATSSIDTKTELIIQDAIKKVLHGRTSLIIAHRLSTIVNADKIVVLEKGEILEMGNHEELLNKKGKYFELYENQFKKQ